MQIGYVFHLQFLKCVQVVFLIFYVNWYKQKLEEDHWSTTALHNSKLRREALNQTHINRVRPFYDIALCLLCIYLMGFAISGMGTSNHHRELLLQYFGHLTFQNTLSHLNFLLLYFVILQSICFT